jgi:ATP-dependent protease ClpP protease subunit
MSSGGEIVSSLSAMDTILKCRAPINTIVDGNCASAATFLSIVGKRRYIKRNSFMMIHQLSAGALGKYNEVKDDIRNIEQLMRIMKDIYSKYTKVPTRKLNEVLKHDLWWKADVCLKYGLVDEIL